MNIKAAVDRKNNGYRYRPVLYFAMAYLFTWIFWVPAIFLKGNIAVILMLLGLISPAVVSTVFILASGSPALKEDMFFETRHVGRILQMYET